MHDGEYCLQLLHDRGQWLSSCEELAGWLDRTTQSVLQLENSREGLVWSRSAGADRQPFLDYADLLQQRLDLVHAHQHAQEEVGLTPRCCVFWKPAYGCQFCSDCVLK